MDQTSGGGGIPPNPRQFAPWTSVKKLGELLTVSQLIKVTKCTSI